jgi:hypothetical protein
LDVFCFTTTLASSESSNKEDEYSSLPEAAASASHAPYCLLSPLAKSLFCRRCAAVAS